MNCLTTREAEVTKLVAPNPLMALRRNLLYPFIVLSPAQRVLTYMCMSITEAPSVCTDYYRSRPACASIYSILQSLGVGGGLTPRHE